MVKKPIKEFILRNVSPDNLINQAKGLKLVKERKRQEKEQANFIKFSHTESFLAPNRQTKRQKVSDQIQRGYDIVEKWKDENER